MLKNNKNIHKIKENICNDQGVRVKMSGFVLSVLKHYTQLYENLAQRNDSSVSDWLMIS